MSTTMAVEAGADGDALRLRGLRRMRAIALSLLLLAAVVYVLTLDRDAGWAYLNAAAEAAMVGALADWFAVTALFRRPLGLPIPHTAIIPNRKDALARSLEDFVATNFLAESVIRDKVSSAEPSRRVGAWLAEQKHSERVVAEAARLVRGGLSVLRDEDVTSFVETALLPRLMDEPMSPIAGRLLGDVVAEGAHHGLVDLTLVELHGWLSENAETVTRLVGNRAPRWSPKWVNARVTRRVHREVVAWVEDVRDQPGHPARKAFDDMLARLADDLQNDPEVMERLEKLKHRVLSHPRTASTATALWNAVQRSLIDAVEEPDGLLRQRGVDALTGFGRRLLEDEPLRARIDGHAADAAAYVVTNFGSEIATVISDTVNRWDGKETADRIELYVGRDLQFIRINGTIVGALAGLAIHTVSVLL
ncbi:MAG: DUF445 family protein [Streptosporangiales bacterium]|nr:DUF445 family protein [Streptosporangiales bacterium]